MGKPADPVALAPAVPVITEAPDQGSAMVAAHRQGSKVAVASLRSEVAQTFANPDGSLTLAQSVMPERVKLGDRWVGIDPTLVERPDGTIGPRAATAAVSFSGGGDGVFARISAEGKEVALTWPRPLPKPTIKGNTATYAEVLPGVDLRAHAQTEGLSHELVVKTRAAAANPELAKIRFGLVTTGVTMSTDAAGNIKGVDGTGRVVFQAPPAKMWESGDEGKRREAKVAVTFGKAEVSLVPDMALLADPTAVLPIVIDPQYRYHAAWPSQWNLIRRSHPNDIFSNYEPEDQHAILKGVVRTGINPEVGGAWLDRSLFRFDTSPLAGKKIIDATFKIRQGWKNEHTCDENATPEVQLWWTGGIGGATTWNNGPGWHRHLASARSAAKLWQPCGPDWVGFNFNGAAQETANAGWTEITMGLKDAEETSINGWKRFYAQISDGQTWYPRIEVTYNTRPDRAHSLATEPALTSCHNCGGRSYVGGDSIRLKGVISDPDGGHLAAGWDIYTPEKHNTSLWTLPSGSTFQATFDLTPFDDETVTWEMWGHDGELASPDPRPWGPGFTVDRTSPDKAPTVSSTLYQPDTWGGGVGVASDFTFTSGETDATKNDIDRYSYWFTGGVGGGEVNAPGLGKPVTVRLAPTVDGPLTLFVRAKDRAGNDSPTQEFRFYVRAGNGPKAQWSLDGNAQDSAFLGDRHGTLYGNPLWTPGAVGAAVDLDGVDDRISMPNTIRNRASFTVSAWVNLKKSDGARAAVSQDGVKFPGFVLWYRNDPNVGPRWVFGVPNSTTEDKGTVFVSSKPGMVELNTWTHLAGVYDSIAKEIRFYVNGTLTETTPHSGPLTNAPGTLLVGRTMWGDVNNRVDYWAGGIDEVRAYDRALSTADLRALISKDNVQVGQWKFDERSGATAGNAVDGGQALVLNGGAQFVPDEVQGNAIKLTSPGDFAVSPNPVVATGKSFSVAGWVKLDQRPAVGQAVTAVSQGGPDNSGFSLGYRELADGGHWEFHTTSNEAPIRPPDAYTRSGPTALVDAPTHLAATYDAMTKEIKLYVNGKWAGTAPRDKVSDIVGPLTVGQGKVNGVTGQQWTGTVDELRVYSRSLDVSEIEGIVARDDVMAGSWSLDGNAKDGSTSCLNKPEKCRSGTPNGVPGWSAGQSLNPAPNLAAHLDGADDHISVPHTLDTSKSFAVSAWAKLDSVSGRPVIVSQDGANIMGFALTTSPTGEWMFETALEDKATAGFNVAKSNIKAQVGAWTHLVGVHNAEQRQLFLYVNGAPAADGPLATGFDAANGLQIGRGKFDTRPVEYVAGQIDDVRAYQRTLFDSEIRALAGRDLSLSNNLRFDETGGTNAADSVGARNATLSNGASFASGRVGNSIKFDGVDDTATTNGVDVHNDTSFTVSAWVQLTDENEQVDQVSAVSLDGGSGGKMRLGYRGSAGRWVFEMPEPDTGLVTRAALTVRRETEVGPDKWVHLTGVYDSDTKSIWLYVNGDRRAEGVLQTPWHSNGPLRIGAAHVDGQVSQYWPGRVDDVRMYTGALATSQIRTLYFSYPDGSARPVPKVLPPDGATVRDQRKTYRFVGGAPIAVNCASIACGTPASIPNWRIDQFDNMNRVPSTGSVARDVRNLVYLFVGGAPFKVDNCGTPCANPVLVSNESIDSRDHMYARPAEGTVFQVPDAPATEGGPARIWLTVGGGRIPYLTEQEFTDTGHTMDQLRPVPQKVTDMISKGMGRAAVVRAPDSATTPNGVYVIVNGSRIAFANMAEFTAAGYDGAKIVLVPNRELELLPTKIPDRSLLRAPDSTNPNGVYLVVGGAAAGFANVQEITETGHTIDEIVNIPSRVLNPMTVAKIADGTVVRAANAAQAWRIQGTSRVATTDTTNVQVIPLRLLNTFPIVSS